MAGTSVQNPTDIAPITDVTDNLPDDGGLDDLALIKAVTDVLPDSGALSTINAATVAIQAVTDVQANHLPLFGGTVYHVDAAQADNTGDGTTPATAKKTITAGIGVASAGDAVNVKAGTYAESVVMNLVGLELWCEIGVFIAPASGVALTVSATSCRVRGILWVTAFAGQIGVNITANFANVAAVRVLAGAVGFSVVADGSFLQDCRAGLQTVTGFDITGSKGIYDECSTSGTGGATRGYYINGGADIGVLHDCTSVDHGTAGYEIATGSANWAVKECASGAGDGRWVDADHASTWPGFEYDSEVASVMDLGGGTTYNLFQVTGSVRLTDIYGNVEEQIENVSSTLHLEAYSTGGTADITDSPGTNIQAAVVGSLLIRNEDSTSAITLVSAATPAIVESTGWKDPKVPVDVVADADQTTYVRAVLSDALSAGEIHWHAHWEPLSDNGFVNGV